MTREEQIKMASEIIAHGCSDELEAALIQDFPELKESEDERIKKWLIEEVSSLMKSDLTCDDYKANARKAIAWLEKQKEQKPSISCGHENDIEWSEEDATCLEYALWCVMKTRNFVAKDACDLDACRCAEKWLESLRPRPHWKPTEEQMEKLNIAIACYEGDWGEDNAKPLRELFEQLKKL